MTPTPTPTTNDPAWQALMAQDPLAAQDNASGTNQTQPVSSGSAERQEAYADQEKVVLEEKAFPKELEPGVKDWLTKLETGEEISLPQPVTDDQGQVVASNATPSQVIITLPMSEDQLEKALAQKLVESVRWLGEWMKRMARIVGGKFDYKFKG